MSGGGKPRVSREDVTRLWFDRQGLSCSRGQMPLTKRSFADHLQRTGGLQLDSVNVIDRAHYLTLWSRFGSFDRARVDDWSYDRSVAYEYWGHEASILPICHLPIGRRRMRRFPAEVANRSWWQRYQTPPASKRRVLRRLRDDGPLESNDFERQAHEIKVGSGFDAAMSMPKEDKRSLKLLWHTGSVAVCSRRHFRCVYDLAERVYPETEIASPSEYEDSWLRIGLSGNGVVSEAHLSNYITGPSLDAVTRRRVITRALKRGEIVEVEVEGSRAAWFAKPEHLDSMTSLESPRGTNLLCPFDSLLWQRKRAAELLDFEYRIEIYVPASKRKYGYYVLPVLHDGRLVGRVDPKLHRDREALEIRKLQLEPSAKDDAGLHAGLRDALQDLASFLGASKLDLPRGWQRKLR